MTFKKNKQNFMEIMTKKNFKGSEKNHDSVNQHHFPFLPIATAPCDGQTR